MAGRWAMGLRSSVFHYFKCGDRWKLAWQPRCHNAVSSANACGLRARLFQAVAPPRSEKRKSPELWNHWNRLYQKDDPLFFLWNYNNCHSQYGPGRLIRMHRPHVSKDIDKLAISREKIGQLWRGIIFYADKKSVQRRHDASNRRGSCAVGTELQASPASFVRISDSRAPCCRRIAAARVFSRAAEQAAYCSVPTCPLYQSVGFLCGKLQHAPALG